MESGKEIEGVHTPYPKAPDYWPYAGITGSVALWEESGDHGKENSGSSPGRHTPSAGVCYQYFGRRLLR